MRKTFLITICSVMLLSANLLHAQEPAAKFNKNIFVEGLGNGIVVAVNYDMRLKRGVQDGLGVRGGIGGGNFEGQTSNGDYVDLGLITFPLGVNYLVGKRRSSFEAGLGITPIYVNVDAASIDNEFFSGKGWAALGVLNMGYRFQPIRNGVMFRLDWTPVFGPGGFSSRFFGLSLGFGFK